MRKVRYVVAASLDEFIAGPNGEVDWIASCLGDAASPWAPQKVP